MCPWTESFAKEEKFDTKIELLLLPVFILSAKPFSAFMFISSKKKNSLEEGNYFQ